MRGPFSLVGIAESDRRCLEHCIKRVCQLRPRGELKSLKGIRFSPRGKVIFSSSPWNLEAEAKDCLLPSGGQGAPCHRERCDCLGITFLTLLRCMRCEVRHQGVCLPDGSSNAALAISIPCWTCRDFWTSSHDSTLLERGWTFASA